MNTSAEAGSSITTLNITMEDRAEQERRSWNAGEALQQALDNFDAVTDRWRNRQATDQEREVAYQEFRRLERAAARECRRVELMDEWLNLYACRPRLDPSLWDVGWPHRWCAEMTEIESRLKKFVPKS